MGLSNYDADTTPTEKTSLCSQTEESNRGEKKRPVQQESQSPRHSCSSLSKNINVTESNASYSDGKVPSLWSSSKLQLLVLATLFVGDMLAFMSLSILAPFFPGEAWKKGMSSAATGWVIGIFSLVQVFLAPVMGKLIPVVGSRFLLMSGIFFGGGCTVLFGKIDQIPITQDNNLTFTIFCFVLRIFLAVGNTAAITSIFAIATKTFPDNISTVLGLLEAAIGFGLMLGPPLGGAIYQVGGFLAPFVVVGTAMMLTVLLFYFILPEDDSEGSETEQASILALLKIPVIDLILVTLVVSALIGAGLFPILQPNLIQFNLSPTEVGLAFLLPCGTYAILAPISGRIGDCMENNTPLMIIGFAILTLGFLLLGPSDVIGLGSYKELWLNLVSLFLVGAGISLTIVPTIDKIFKATVKAGIQESMATHGIIAGIWTSVYAFGEFVGPIYCGTAYDAIGFSWTMTIVAVATSLMFLLTIFIYLYEKDVCCRWNGVYEKEQIF